MRKKFVPSEDAVSEVIDFITLIGILVICIGLIGIMGYPMVKKAQESNHIENTRQSFIVLANNLNKVVVRQSPSQNVELKMYGGTLSIAGDSTINITARNSTGAEIELGEWQMRNIESLIGETYIAYEGAGVWIKYPQGNSILVSKPLITYLNNILVIPVVTMGGSSSTGGSGMTRIVAKGEPYLETPYKNVSHVNVTINSTYSDGWNEYFSKIATRSNCISYQCIAEFDNSNIDVYILRIQLDTEIE